MQTLTAVAAALVFIGFGAGLIGGKLLLDDWLKTQSRHLQVAATSIVMEAEAVLDVAHAARSTVGRLVDLEHAETEPEVAVRLRALEELAVQARVLSSHAAEIVSGRTHVLRSMQELRLLRRTYSTVLELRRSMDEQLDWFDAWNRACWVDTES